MRYMDRDADVDLRLCTDLDMDVDSKSQRLQVCDNTARQFEMAILP